MTETAEGRRWHLTPDGVVEPEDGGPVGPFTAQEWREQQWPPCPVCGSTNAEPDRVNVQGLQDRFPKFVVGAWECPNDCDPRPALRGRSEQR